MSRSAQGFSAGGLLHGDTVVAMSACLGDDGHEFTQDDANERLHVVWQQKAAEQGIGEITRCPGTPPGEGPQ